MTHTQTTLLDKRINVALGREQGKSRSSIQPSFVSSSEIKLHNREIAIEVTGGARTPRRLYVPPTPIPNMEVYEKAWTGLSPPAGYLYKPWV